MATDWTTYLGLALSGSSSGSSESFFESRYEQFGDSGSSNMQKIDDFASWVSGSLQNLDISGIIPIVATLVSTNYYECNTASLTSYQSNQVISLSIGTKNSGPVLLNINGLGTKNVYKSNVIGVGSALTGNELQINRNYLCMYNGINWVLMGASTSDQISVSGSVTYSVGNLLAISGSGTIIDSGISASAISGSYYQSGSFVFYNLAIGTRITTVTGSLTLGVTHSTVLCNCTSGSIGITLPTPSSTILGRQYMIKKIDSSGNYFKITNTLDGTANRTYSTQYQGITVQCDASAWYIISTV